MKKTLFFILSFLFLNCYSFDVWDGIYSPYSNYTLQEIQNLKCKKINNRYFNYLFVYREFRIFFKLDPFEMFSDETNKSQSEEGALVEYFSLKISWNF